MHTTVGPVLLLVDDDESFPLLLPLKAQKAGLPFSIRFVGDGERAIKYLSGEGEYGNRTMHPFPHLMVLDLNMPRVNGFEVLEWKGKRPELKSLPVVVWSSSELERDIKRSLALGAACFFHKPPEFHSLVEILKRLEKYWQKLD